MKIYVAGHRGMVGSAICRALETRAGVTLVTRTSSKLNLINQAEVAAFMAKERPDQVILAAAHGRGCTADRDA